MDVNMIRELASLLVEKDLTLLDYSEGGSHLLLEREPAGSRLPAGGLRPASAAAPVSAEKAAPVGEEEGFPAAGPVDFNRLTEVKSPMVGVFYAAPAPGAAPFVSIGSKVKRGDVLCIIEAMKLQNEITAESDGEIVDVCVRNGEIAEYGQVLFKMF